jgi:hypothetical protein
VASGVGRWLVDPPISAIRWIGLAGSVMLGIDAYLFGAFRVIRLHVDPQSVATGPNGIAIMALWILGTAALAGAWWFGRGLTSRVSTRWVTVTAAIWMLPMLVIPPISSRDVYAYSCQGALYAGGGDPYHQGISSLPCQWLDSVSVVWRDTPTPYGPGFIMTAGGFSKLGSLTATIVAFRLLAVLGVVLIAVSIPPIARHFSLPVERSMWLILACPLVVIHLVGGAHNDAITIGLLLAALAVIASRYERISGLILGGGLIGMSVAVKPTILVAVPFIALYAAGGADAPSISSVAHGGLHHGDARDTHPFAGSASGPGPLGFPPVGDMLRRGGAVLGSAFVALLILTLISGLGFGWVSALIHAGGEPSWTSPSTSFGTSVDALLRLFGIRWNLVPQTRAAGLVLLPIALVLIFWRARWADRFYAAGIALLAVTFFAPIAQPWYLVWPLVMLSLTRARARWFGIAVIVACYAAMTNGVGLDGLSRLGLSIGMGVTAVFALVAGVAWLLGREPARDDAAVPVESLVPASVGGV